MFVSEDRVVIGCDGFERGRGRWIGLPVWLENSRQGGCLYSSPYSQSRFEEDQGNGLQRQQDCSCRAHDAQLEICETRGNSDGLIVHLHPVPTNHTGP